MISLCTAAPRGGCTQAKDDRLFNNYSTSARWTRDGRQPTRHVVKTTDFQLVFNFEQTRTVTILGEHGIMHGSYTMMAQPIRALELHYPMIQILIKSSIARHHVKTL